MMRPIYSMSDIIVDSLKRTLHVQEQVEQMPLTASVLKGLRETARLFSTHYSTMIEGNNLSADQVEEVLQHKGHFPGRERDEGEVKGYYAALAWMEKYSYSAQESTPDTLQMLHALVVAGGKERVKPTPYRDGQNIIRDGRTRSIAYLPPEAKDVPALMHDFVTWLNSSHELPAPIVAGITHYQFATIHPYYDGNGRTARLLATLVLRMRGYSLKGLYSLEEYYARNLGAYYEALAIGPSHNYYEGRADANITSWLEYFCLGMAISFENVVKHLKVAQEQGSTDQAELLNSLDPKQRKALDLFLDRDVITVDRVAALFGFSVGEARALCKKWVEQEFFGCASGGYHLADTYRVLVRR